MRLSTRRAKNCTTRARERSSTPCRESDLTSKNGSDLKSIRLRNRQYHRHFCAFSHGALNVNCPVRALNDRFADRKAEPRATTVSAARPIGAVEALEYVWQCRFRDTFPIILHS